MHRPISVSHIVLLTSLFAGLHTWAAPPSSGLRIPTQTALQPPPLSVLAAQLVSADEVQQWEFAAITLDVLRATYLKELEAAAQDKASTPARRAKLARWQRATQGLIRQLEVARQKLAEGGQFSFHVDPRHQILIIVEGQTVVVSGPRSGALDEIAAPVLEQFCAYNDCSILDMARLQESAPEPERAGVWIFHQRMQPAYEIGSGLRCEFDAIANPDQKAQLCRQLAIELQRLATALQQAAAQGYVIDWERLQRSPPGGRPNAVVVVNAEGAYLQVELRLLTGVDNSDWPRILTWLKHRLDGNPRQLVISHTERYLAE